jgi:hypothetical protein
MISARLDPKPVVFIFQMNAIQMNRPDVVL